MTDDHRSRRSNYGKYAIFGAAGVAAVAIGIALTVIFFSEPEGEFAIDVTERPEVEDTVLGDPSDAPEQLIPTAVHVLPRATPAGSMVLVQGDGFNTGDEITISFNDEEIATIPEIVIADDNGTFDAEIRIPEVESAEHNVAAIDESGNAASFVVAVIDEEADDQQNPPDGLNGDLPQQ